MSIVLDAVGVADALADDATAALEVGATVDAVLWCFDTTDVTTVPPLDSIDAMMADAET